MTIDRTILIGLVILIAATFGEVLRENVRSEIYCVVKADVLICPIGTTWKYVQYEKPWEAVNCCP